MIRSSVVQSAMTLFSCTYRSMVEQLLTGLAHKSYISEAPYANWNQCQRTVSSSPSNDLWILRFLFPIYIQAL